MTIMPLLTCTAVPFCFPEDDRSIAARRHRARQLRDQMEQPRNRHLQDRHILASVAGEASNAINNISDEEDDRRRRARRAYQSPVKTTHSRHRGGSNNSSNNYRQPPNSPNFNTGGLTFDFPDVPAVANRYYVNRSDGLRPLPSSSAASAAVAAAADSSSDESTAKSQNLLSRAARVRRSQRKRRRAPSFKNKERVAPKVGHEEADDEDSDHSNGKAGHVSHMDRRVAYITRATSKISTGDFVVDVDDEDDVDCSCTCSRRNSIYGGGLGGLNSSEVRWRLHVEDEKRKVREQLDAFGHGGQILRKVADGFDAISAVPANNNNAVVAAAPAAVEDAYPAYEQQQQLQQLPQLPQLPQLEDQTTEPSRELVLVRAFEDEMVAWSVRCVNRLLPFTLPPFMQPLLKACIGLALFKVYKRFQ